FILDPRVRAQVTMYSSAPMTPPAFYQAFLSILEVYGFIAQPTGNNIEKIVPDADARYGGEALVPRVSSSSDEIVTQVIAVKNVSAAELTFLTAMTCVTISSELELTRGTRASPPYRASASGTIFSMLLPVGWAMKP